MSKGWKILLVVGLLTAVALAMLAFYMQGGYSN